MSHEQGGTARSRMRSLSVLLGHASLGEPHAAKGANVLTKKQTNTYSNLFSLAPVLSVAIFPLQLSLFGRLGLDFALVRGQGSCPGLCMLGRLLWHDC